MPTLSNRLQHAWNAFMNRDPTVIYRDVGPGFSYRPDRPRVIRGGERTIVSAVLNRIALDVAATEIRHVRLDDNDRFIEEINSGLNTCLSLEANVDQTGRALIQDICLSMLDEGCVAVIPTDTSINPDLTASYDITELRVGKIIQWHPKHVRVRLYNEKLGRQEEILVPKSTTAIIENPMYAVMNEPNSTLQRLIRKLAILDVIDEQSGAGKLDLIIQLPYVIKSEARRAQAESRRKDIEMQLAGSKYGIAYTDGTEHITQLNRSADNQLMSQIEYLTSMLYSQLGITAEILNGTADEKTMNNYYARITEPILSAIVDEMTRKYLTKTARTQHQAIRFFRDPFKLMPTTQIADIADRLTRNEIMSSNEFRQIIGLKPSSDPKADELRNKNMPVQDEVEPESTNEELEPVEEDPDLSDISEEEIADMQKAEIDSLDEQLDALEKTLGLELKHYASPYYNPVKAHEYYMKNGELKGRKSTSGLTDEGKEAASYVKGQLKSERDKKIADSKSLMKRRITTSSNKTKSAINSRSLFQKNTLKSNSEKLSNTIKANRTNMEKLIETNASQLESKLGSEKAKTLKSIASYASSTSSKIEQLQKELEGYSDLEKAHNSERISREIAQLRADNKAKKAELEKAFSNKSSGMKAENKAEAANIRTGNRDLSAKLRSENQARAASIRSETNQINASARKTHKDTVAKARSENKATIKTNAMEEIQNGRI